MDGNWSSAIPEGGVSRRLINLQRSHRKGGRSAIDSSPVFYPQWQEEDDADKLQGQALVAMDKEGT